MSVSLSAPVQDLPGGSPRQVPETVSSSPSSLQREFGFVLEGRDIVVDDVRVRGVGTSSAAQAAHPTPERKGDGQAGGSWGWGKCIERG